MKMVPIDSDSFGDMIPLNEFVSCVKSNVFTPDDGIGHWATETEEDVDTDVLSGDPKPDWATHVMWYNK